jgi:RIO-like serine/threonine protein kinase
MAGAVRRDTRCARWWLKPVARRLAAREARALDTLAGVAGVPRLVSWQGGVLVRSWLEGRPMQVARPRDPAYYRRALRLLSRLHRAGVAHNDLAKEPNWLVLADGAPALLDFQLASVSARRGPLFRARAREDIRYLLKHKRSYCPQALTARQQRMLAAPGALSRIWMATGKRLYWLVTRRLLGWADREGAGDRNL